MGKKCSRQREQVGQNSLRWEPAGQAKGPEWRPLCQGGGMHPGSLLERLSAGGSHLLEKIRDHFVIILLNILPI